LTTIDEMAGEQEHQEVYKLKWIKKKEGTTVLSGIYSTSICQEVALHEQQQLL